MKSFKMRINHLGHVQPEQPNAPLGHPVYQVINVPDDVTHQNCAMLFDRTCLVGGPGATTYDYSSLGHGRFAKPVEAGVVA
jgi:hypothetical protein